MSLVVAFLTLVKMYSNLPDEAMMGMFIETARLSQRLSGSCVFTVIAVLIFLNLPSYICHPYYRIIIKRLKLILKLIKTKHFQKAKTKLN